MIRRPRPRLLSDHGRSVLLTVVPLALAVLTAALAGTL